MAIVCDKYPLPEYAVSVWVAGDNLMVAFPGTVSERGHTIKLPASATGLSTAITIMKERAQARSLFLGNRGTPTQYEIENDQRYKAFMRAVAEAKRPKPTSRELDEIMAELEIEL
jgi:hypothetical protein